MQMPTKHAQGPKFGTKQTKNKKDTQTTTTTKTPESCMSGQEFQSTESWPLIGFSNMKVQGVLENSRLIKGVEEKFRSVHLG